MANDLTTMLLSGNATGLAADPALLQVAPEISLAQAMMQSGLSGAPAYPAQAIGRLAQALAGQHMLSDAQGQMGDLYGRGVEAASRALPEDHPLQKFLKSPDPYARMVGMRNLDKALIQLGEAGAESAKNPALIARAGGEARAKAPTEPGGEMTQQGPYGPEKVPITAEERMREAARRAAPPVIGGAVNALNINGQPQNLTGPIIPPGGASASQPAPQVLPTPPVVEVARGETLGSIANYYHTTPQAIARENGIDPEAPLQMGTRLTIPSRVQPPVVGGASAAPPSAAPAATAGAPGPGSFNAAWNDRAAGPTRLGGVPVETPEYKAQMETFGEGGKAIGGQLKEYIDAGGKNAQDRINALNSIESAMRTNNGKGIVTGPQAESILHFKEMLDGMGIKTDWVKEGMPQAELITKMNAQLASASIKAMSPRPTQFEFQTFRQNNPGLANSREGTLALIDVLRQTAEQDRDIGRLAQNQANWRNMPQVVDQYYAEHGLRNPFSGRLMREEIAAARGGTGGIPAAVGTGGTGGGAALPGTYGIPGPAGAHGIPGMPGPQAPETPQAAPGAGAGGIPQLNPGEAHDLGGGWSVRRTR